VEINGHTIQLEINKLMLNSEETDIIPSILYQISGRQNFFKVAILESLKKRKNIALNMAH